MAEEIEYRVVEVALVTDEELTRVVNEWVRAGWTFDGFQFAMRDSSRRPSMAFAMFVRSTAVVGLSVDGGSSLEAPEAEEPEPEPQASGAPRRRRRSLQ